MRGIYAAATALCMAAVLIAGCNQQNKAAAPAAPVAAVTYDQSPESNQKFLADNKAKPGVKTQPSGLQYRVIKGGTGASPQSGEDMVTVTYKGSLIDGKVFDQTEPGKTATFPAGQLIAGWVEALSLMKEGDEWELVIPSELGYGAAGAGQGVIPPNQTLVFDMQLLKVEPAKAP
jgi:FKBP-type peptidyl-prolyl cis-trans isomerase